MTQTWEKRNCLDARQANHRNAPYPEASRSFHAVTAEKRTMNLQSCRPAIPVFALWTLLVTTTPAAATEIVYTPVNPSFGGSPLNGPVLLNSANAQNHYTAPYGGSSSYKAPSALQNFNQQLEAMILSRIATSVTGSLFDSTGKLKPGVVDTSAFTVTVIQDPANSNLLHITTLDKATGATTTFDINAGL
jgi:curli production assembly/transport component CsgF